MNPSLLAAVKPWFHALVSAANWVWPVKFLVGAVLSVIAGGGVLSFLLENATHLYALTYGFRPPVEGLPYLRTLVSSGSAILLLLAASIAALLMGIFGGMARMMARHGDKVAIDLTKVKLWIAILISLSGWLLLSTLLYFGEKTRGSLGQYCGWPLLHCDPKPNFSLGYLAYSLAILFPMFFMMFRPAFAWVATTGAIAAYYVWVSSNILPPDEYARLLRSTGFGGGMSVAVETRQSDAGCASLTLTGYLLLRTTENLIVYESPSERIHEVPVRCVGKISYGTGGMSSLDYKLPRVNPLIERQRVGA